MNEPVLTKPCKRITSTADDGSTQVITTDIKELVESLKAKVDFKEGHKTVSVNIESGTWRYDPTIKDYRYE